jgi:hypothetical protein
MATMANLTIAMMEFLHRMISSIMTVMNLLGTTTQKFMSIAIWWRIETPSPIPLAMASCIPPRHLSQNQMAVTMTAMIATITTRPFRVICKMTMP